MCSIEGLSGSVSATQRATTKFVTELRALLSPEAVVYTKEDNEFLDLTLRWQKYKSPTFAVAVAVACEDDIVRTVCETENLCLLVYSMHRDHITFRKSN